MFSPSPSVSPTVSPSDSPSLSPSPTTTKPCLPTPPHNTRKLLRCTWCDHTAIDHASQSYHHPVFGARSHCPRCRTDAYPRITIETAWRACWACGLENELEDDNGGKRGGDGGGTESGMLCKGCGYGVGEGGWGDVVWKRR